jgi:diacylglycerol kinase family enzyme
MNPAFAYIYDELLSERRLEKDVALLETELSRRGIEGRIVRLAMFRQPRDIVFELTRGPVKNIVFVGNDLTLQKMMPFLPDIDLTIGYIALCQPSAIAQFLGIPTGASGVDTVAARLVDTLDIGKINDRYFFTEVVAPETRASLDIEGRYRLQPSDGGAIAIRNLAGTGSGKCSHPQDGRLEAFIQARMEPKGMAFWKKSTLSESYIFFEKGTLISEKPVEIFVDGQSMRGDTFKLSVLPRKIRMITGKQKGWELVRKSTS